MKQSRKFKIIAIINNISGYYQENLGKLKNMQRSNLKDIIFNKLLIILFTSLFFSCDYKSSRKEQVNFPIATEISESLNIDTIPKSWDMTLLIFQLMSKTQDTTNAFKGYVSDLFPDFFDSSLGQLPHPYTIYDTLHHKKENGQFTLQFDNGESSTFQDLGVEYGDGMTTYEYVGYLSNMKKYIIAVLLWENSACLLVDKSDGKMYAIPSIPIFNQDGNRLIVQENNPYENETTYYIYNRIENSLDLACIISGVEYRNTIKIYWKNNYTIDIEYSNLKNHEYSMHARLFAVSRDNLKPLPSYWCRKYIASTLACSYFFDVGKTQTSLSISGESEHLDQEIKYDTILDSDSVLHLFQTDNKDNRFNIKKNDGGFYISGLLESKDSEYWISIDTIEN